MKSADECGCNFLPLWIALQTGCIEMKKHEGFNINIILFVIEICYVLCLTYLQTNDVQTRP